MELFQASHQWATRPDDERYTSLTEMLSVLKHQRENSRETVVASRRLHVAPDPDNLGLQILGPGGQPALPTHHAFSQIAALAEAPAGYLRTIPSPIAADCINYGLQFKRPVADIGVLLQRNGTVQMRCATGPAYGRVWNSDIVQSIVTRFGNGFEGDWRVPGIRKVQLAEVTKENTTLFAGDRDMFIFLADEKNRVEIPNRRTEKNGIGLTGLLSRGFFVWNSEVGARTLGIATFLFDEVCQNRIVWGAQQYKQVKIKHSSGAPVRFIDEIEPALLSYRESSTKGIVQAIEAARAARIDAAGKEVSEFLAARFGKNMPGVLQDVSMDEEGHPIETLWDAVVAVTAYARKVGHQDQRVEWEQKAGELLNLKAA